MDIANEIENILTAFKDNAMLIAVICFLALMFLFGFKKGFLLKLISFCSIIVSIFITYRICPKVIEFASKSETVGGFFSELGKSIVNPEHLVNEKSPLYKLLGLENIADNIGELIAGFSLKIICFVVIFILLRIALKLVEFIIEQIKHINIINSFDQTFGALLGLLEGFFYVWIFMIIITIPTFSVCRVILESIEKSGFLSFLYENNIIMQLLINIIK